MMNEWTEPPARELLRAVQEALKQWHQPDATATSLAHLYVVRQLAGEAGSMKRATNRVLLQAIQEMELRYKEDATLLRRSFLDNELDRAIANDLNIAESTFYRQKNQAVQRLAETLQGMEQAALCAHQRELLQRLPPPSFVTPIGLERPLAQLEQVILQPGPPWFLFLAGIGGIGKTTLADALVRHLIAKGQLDGMGWVTGRQSILHWEGGIRPYAETALTFDSLVEKLLDQFMGVTFKPDRLSQSQMADLLRSQLKQQPHLVVIDNLETVPDAQALVAGLRDFAGPSKFLFTSRESLFGEPDIYHFSVAELSTEFALQLIRQEAAQRNLVHLHQASDAELMSILDLVGGNPLAIRLVVGQTHVQSLDYVLDNLRAARGKKAEELYSYIYRQAWDQLDERTRRVFVAMPLVSHLGATVEQLAELCEMEPHVVGDVLYTLVRHNLVDSRGDLHQRRYTIHNLTRTFLHEQVIRW